MEVERRQIVFSFVSVSWFLFSLFFCEVFSAVSFAVVVQHVLQCVVSCHAHKNARVFELFIIYKDMYRQYLNSFLGIKESKEGNLRAVCFSSIEHHTVTYGVSCSCTFCCTTLLLFT